MDPSEQTRQERKQPPLDGAYLRALSNGDGAVLREALADFLRESEIRMASIDEAAEAKDAALLRAETGRLVANATAIGAEPLARAAARLESAAGDHELWPYLLKRTSDEHARVVRYMRGETF